MDTHGHTYPNALRAFIDPPELTGTILDYNNLAKKSVGFNSAEKLRCCKNSGIHD